MTQQVVPRGERDRRILDDLGNDSTDDCEQVHQFGPEDFTDASTAKLERDKVFGRVPTIVAHSSELPRPHDFLTVRMPRNHIIVVRQTDGSVKSFVNLCRHRGAMVERREKGRCRLFSCRYHRWSYDIDGSLRAVTRENTFGDVDKSQAGLVELPTEERHGWIWIVDDATAEIDVADWLGPEVDQILAGYRLQDLKCLRANGFDVPVDWKVAQGFILEERDIECAAGEPAPTGSSTIDDLGRHVRCITSPTSDESQRENSSSAETCMLLPNSVLSCQADHFQLLTFRPHPRDPGRCHVEMRLIVPTPEASGLDEPSWEQKWKSLLDVLRDEKFPVLQRLQEGSDHHTGSEGQVQPGHGEMNRIFHRELGKLAT
ncbi:MULTISPECIES: aromatic ring-hydroxylating dioxygenase subunit alpha [unclassified Mycolicibacterium]|uniref:aromatic ring-hydroxylating oxygenase subunit alpha n=1 Tax=unclassified Mycolicibacterium TaxID=2636767 RepID=UPI0012DFC306|nr:MULTISPECIES: aromatic ring-hydroxylating dioxygenase subunit alpha [unclassified Mycolicibacterium]MUL82319.1 aromatic ring-hydroxylating dioxygenase subunit alpha [Mycolicibacterium sp. CBMA 329]MUL88085.1 aromatic ring-hydroxylating dioxygenase subunit alpha [Mycolicibacterium sp. CBMA 331]MUM02415.1 aromatic ring-hydroxylating dioxygenase subunit alpha [Mycolicibacterium sp. CBMA 334]MUM24818.1 aromatic ring-hydroxylating dioxygenase subunit alpha [Mycolicibacterium sp. CBMA 295]MUM3838